MNTRQRKKVKGGGGELLKQSLEIALETEATKTEESKTEDMFSGTTDIGYHQLLSENQRLRSLLEEKERLILLQNASIIRFKGSLEILLGNLKTADTTFANKAFADETNSKTEDAWVVSLFEESDIEESIAGLGDEVIDNEVIMKEGLDNTQVNSSRKKQSLLELLGYGRTGQIKEA